MGQYLSVQKKHIIEYADKSFFKWKISEVFQLLSSFCPSLWGNDEYTEYSTELEVNAEEFQYMIEKIKSMSEDEFKEEYGELMDDYYTKAKIVESLQYLYDNRDTNNKWINLSWF